MPRRDPNQRPPAYRVHKSGNRTRAYVLLNGQRVYLGQDGDAARQEYRRLIAEYYAAGCEIPRTHTSDRDKGITIQELARRYESHCEEYYRDAGGGETSSLSVLRLALAGLVNLYGDFEALEFTPNALRGLREMWIRQGLTRSTINSYVSYTRRAFRWAVSCDLLPVDVYSALMTVDNLKAGRSAAKEGKPVEPVPDDVLDKTLPHLPGPVQALVRLQLLCGARPSEVLRLRPCDIDQSGAVWIAKIQRHKTAYKGKSRELLFGPRAQALLRPYLLRRPDEFMFSPREAIQEKAAQAETHRRPGQKPNPRKTGRHVGECYTVASYRRAIKRACEKAGVPDWSPNRLRHAAATKIRKEYGLEAAQVMLGHSHADVTQVYAESNREAGIRVALEFG